MARKEIQLNPGATPEEKGKTFADLLTSPEFASYRVIARMQPSELYQEMDVPTLLETLRAHAKAVKNGNADALEASLVGQSEALQALFVRLTELAMQQNRVSNLSALMKLALRAQSQFRATVEAIGQIKKPPIVYQANFTTGTQQINFGQTQLSGAAYELRQDTRASGYAFKNDSPVETMGKVDWPNNRERKNKSCDARV
jgi:Tfp pilus assembly protein PilV